MNIMFFVRWPPATCRARRGTKLSCRRGMRGKGELLSISEISMGDGHGLQSRQRTEPHSIRPNMMLSTRGPLRNLPGGEARWSPNGTLPLMRPTGARGRTNSLFCMVSLIDRTIKYKMENAVTFSLPPSPPRQCVMDCAPSSNVIHYANPRSARTF